MTRKLEKERFGKALIHCKEIYVHYEGHQWVNLKINLGP